MTNEEIIAVVKALANYRQININWHKDVKTTADRLQDFIGKPDLVVTASEQLQYRPFKSAEEVMQAIREHGDWVQWKGPGLAFHKIITVTDKFIEFSNQYQRYEDCHRQLIFSDGTPFGIKED